jgi:hypothetical protein
LDIFEVRAFTPTKSIVSLVGLDRSPSPSLQARTGWDTSLAPLTNCDISIIGFVLDVQTSLQGSAVVSLQKSQPIQKSSQKAEKNFHTKILPSNFSNRKTRFSNQLS